MSEESTLGSGLTELVAIFRRHGKGDEGVNCGEREVENGNSWEVGSRE